MRLSWPEWLLSATAIAIIAIGVFFVIVRPPFLAEDLRYIGASEEALRASAPRLAQWLSLVFRVMGGFIIATGVLLLATVLTADLSRQPLTLLAVAIAAAMSLGNMAAVNFLIGSDFKWLILAVAGLWTAGIVAQLMQSKQQLADLT